MERALPTVCTRFPGSKNTESEHVLLVLVQDISGTKILPFEIFRVHIVECLAGHVARDKVVALLQRARNCPLRPAIA